MDTFKLEDIHRLRIIAIQNDMWEEYIKLVQIESFIRQDYDTIDDSLDFTAGTVIPVVFH